MQLNLSLISKILSLCNSRSPCEKSKALISQERTTSQVSEPEFICLLGNMTNAPSTSILVEDHVPELVITSVPNNLLSNMLLDKLFCLTSNSDKTPGMSREWIVHSNCTAHVTHDRSAFYAN